MAFDSLFTGVSALNSYQSWIDMLSNNIANTATVGFKGQRMTFADLFYQNIGFASGATQSNGGVNPQSLGLGVKVNTVDTIFSQGGLETTGVNTDLAINGDGFFVLRNLDGSSAPQYTRAGAFSLNSQGILIDPATGLAVQGYQANSAGQVSVTGTPGNLKIPLGLSEQAVGTGFGAKVGPSSADSVFDVQMGGNLDQTQWSQQFLNNVGASPTPGTPYTTSTTIYDSLGVAHQAQITYTPDAAAATAATVANAGAADTTAVTVNPGAPQNDTITITANAGGTSAVVTDSLGSTQTVAAGGTATVGGATFTLANPMPPLGVETITVTAANNGLPSQVDNATGAAVKPSTRWKVSVNFTDGTTFSHINAPGSISAGNVVTAPTYGTGTTGTIGYAYFDQNGQFINTSSIETSASAQGISANASAYLHTTGSTPGQTQGNEMNIVSWGPGAGNNSIAPTGTGTPATGPIALDFSTNASLAGTSTANVINQNGYGAGTLSNITIGQDGTVEGAFTNGQTRGLAQLALATFQNEGGLQRDGGNAFSQTAASGLAQLGTGNTGRFGAVISGALEQSNVSLADQFTKLILAQRSFEANTRGIETADQNLQTLINLRATEN